MVDRGQLISSMGHNIGTRHLTLDDHRRSGQTGESRLYQSSGRLQLGVKEASQVDRHRQVRQDRRRQDR